jgi:hypothetical protein
MELMLVAKSKIRYGIEQEYTLLQKHINWPLGWPLGGYPGPQVILNFLYTFSIASQPQQISSLVFSN